MKQERKCDPPETFLQWVRDEHPYWSERQVQAYVQGYCDGAGPVRRQMLEYATIGC